MSDKINPEHYQGRATIKKNIPELEEDVLLTLESADVIDAFFADNGHLAHAFTYLAREGRKRIESDRNIYAVRIEELEKAMWWINRRKEYLEAQRNAAEMPKNAIR